MKLYDEDISGAGKKRTLLAVSLDEVELLYGMLLITMQHFPKIDKFKSDYAKMHTMRKVFQLYIDERKKN